ncbi:TPA: hypothetical protein ENS27_07010 [bacterium]|nr:hypothetical protein [bacterium]
MSALKPSLSIAERLSSTVDPFLGEPVTPLFPEADLVSGLGLLRAFPVSYPPEPGPPSPIPFPAPPPEPSP